MVTFPRLFKRKSIKTHLPPGSIVFIGDTKTRTTTLSILDYDETNITEKQVGTVEECLPFKDLPTVTWFNVIGLFETKVIEALGKSFGLHPLILEDIVNTGQRPKIDDYGEYLFFVLKMLSYNDEKDVIESEQVSLVLGSNFVISFQEDEGDIFNPIRERIRTSKGLIRRMGPDYLVYALIDTIVDNYFTLIEKLGDRIEDLEDELIVNPEIETLQTIHDIKRELIFLRKSVWPLREVINRMERGGFHLIKGSTGLYLRDVYDHTIQAIDTVETYRDLLSGMLDIYLSSVSNRMNEIMKVLTIVGTIFIPLTFIAGIYGMNFMFMPELKWVWGYPLVLLCMLSIGVFMVFYFRRRGWM